VPIAGRRRAVRRRPLRGVRADVTSIPHRSNQMSEILELLANFIRIFIDQAY
jgi:hypothetical protein